MNRGPAPGAPLGRTEKTMSEKALEAWGAGLPDWVAELAALADREGLRGAEKRVNYSASAISTVINNRYRGDMGRVEESVRGALMGRVVPCPVLGEIGRDQCLVWQKKPFAATSSIRVAVYRACRAGCPHSKLKSLEGPAT
ncbi:transcriptional regulator [Chelativorans alearense]|uniref:transcriptional regulator n=1 Tax=Chelativorans alearense TaxID=2681495 RepID=UPI001FEA9181|nr:transcriptional regulator [Chelativorans alearense]